MRLSVVRHLDIFLLSRAARLALASLLCLGLLSANAPIARADDDLPDVRGQDEGLLDVRRREVGIIPQEHRSKMALAAFGGSMVANTLLGTSIAMVVGRTDNVGVTAAAGLVYLVGAPLAGSTAAWMMGRHLGYDGDWGPTAARGTTFGLLGGAAGAGLGLAAGLALTPGSECGNDGPCLLAAGFVWVVLVGGGGGTGYLLGNIRGSIRGFARSLEPDEWDDARAPRAFSLAPVALPTGEGGLAPGMMLSARF